MQRLYSTFAGGFPGVGLLLLRLVTGVALLICAGQTLSKASHVSSLAPSLIGAAGGILILVGLWTPVAGTLIAIVEIWISLSRAGDPAISIMMAILGATLAMVGPGAWSIDAQLFGRKRIYTP